MNGGPTTHDCTCGTCPHMAGSAEMKPYGKYYSCGRGLGTNKQNFGCSYHPNWPKIMRDHRAMQALRENRINVGPIMTTDGDEWRSSKSSGYHNCRYAKDPADAILEAAEIMCEHSAQ